MAKVKLSDVKKAVLALMNHAEKEGHAHNVKEIAATLPQFHRLTVEKAMKELWSAGKIRQIKNAKGIHWRPMVKNPSPGERKHGPHATADQRKEEAAALKKARAFYGNDDLVTVPRVLKSYKAPSAFVDIGDAVALVYGSDKFDGEYRVYEHEVTKKRRMLISVDGSTIVFDPPLKLTKRGIEG